jgi:hypothetical protein
MSTTEEANMRRHVSLAITALVVALLLGAVLTPMASAQAPYIGCSVPGYSTGSLSTSQGQNWYFTYFPGAPGYSPCFTPGTIDYNYTDGFTFLYQYGYEGFNNFGCSPLYGSGFGYPYNNVFPSRYLPY